MRTPSQNIVGGALFFGLVALLIVYFFYDEAALRKLISQSETPKVQLEEATLAISEGRPDVAVKIYENLSKSGNSDAQFHLANLYLAGKYGLKKDAQKAVGLYEQSAKAGSHAAKAELGHLFFNGEDIGQDFVKARMWLEQAANGGSARATYELGELWKNGWGGDKNLPMAYAWLEIAAQQKYEPAILARDELLKSLSPDQVAEGQSLVGKLKADVQNSG
ncbi:MAG: tetratricopeptide repeat protein [Hyphomicrobiaceae bacterium]